MPLKTSRGNMYPWVSHMHTHLAGACPHGCSYCYVSRGPYGRAPRYAGPLRLVEWEFGVDYGMGRTIFLEHMTDLFAQEVPPGWIRRVMDHCARYPGNTYVWQTKNPERLENWLALMPAHSLIGTTIETNRPLGALSKAPAPKDRYKAMRKLRGQRRSFITIEPIMDFDVLELGTWVAELQPDFVNIGADSKGCNLPEPSAEKVLMLVKLLNDAQVHINRKSNLQRLLREVPDFGR